MRLYLITAFSHWIYEWDKSDVVWEESNVNNLFSSWLNNIAMSTIIIKITF